MLEEFEDTVEEANNEMLIQIEGLKNNMVGDNGALTQIGSSADTMTGSLNDAADAVVNLRNETKELYDLFGSDSKQLEDALTKITEYEDQLKSTTDTTSSLRRSLIKANQAITSKTAEAENYKTALDFATGAKQIKAGSIVKLKKGTYVNYDRHGGSQQDDKGHTG
jgi:chromosome segregation ATPase